MHCMRQRCRISYSLNILKMGLHSININKVINNIRNQKYTYFWKYNVHDTNEIKTWWDCISLNWALMNLSPSRSSASSLSSSASLRLWASYSLYKKYPLPKTPTVTKAFLLCLLQKSLVSQSNTYINGK